MLSTRSNGPPPPPTDPADDHRYQQTPRSPWPEWLLDLTKGKRCSIVLEPIKCAVAMPMPMEEIEQVDADTSSRACAAEAAAVGASDAPAAAVADSSSARSSAAIPALLSPPIAAPNPQQQQQLQHPFVEDGDASSSSDVQVIGESVLQLQSPKPLARHTTQQQKHAQPSVASSIEVDDDPMQPQPPPSVRARAPTRRWSPEPERPHVPIKRAKTNKPAAAASHANLKSRQRLDGVHVNGTQSATASAAAAAASIPPAASVPVAAPKPRKSNAELKQLQDQLAQEKKENRSLQFKLSARNRTIQTLQQERDQAQAALRDERAAMEPPRLQLPPLPRLDHPSAGEVKGKAAGPLRVGYVISTNSDQNHAPHFLSDDIVRLMGFDKAESQEERQRWQIQETDPKATASYSHTEEPELYLQAEALALPLYLQKLFADHFVVVTEPLELVQRLLIALAAGTTERAYATRGAAFMADGHASQDAMQLRELLARIKTFDLLLVPSVLLFTDKARGAPFWYSALRSLEKTADVTVFPLIDVEEQMEIKDLYLTALLRSKNQYLPRDFPEPDAAMDAVSSAFSKWTDQVAFVHEPANRHLAPTVLIPDFDSLLRLSAEKQHRFILDVLAALQSDVTAGGWDVEKDRYFVKGTTSTRSNVAEIVGTADEALNFMKEVHEKGHKLCAAQAGFIVQPCMNGLSWESRTYFNRGRPLPLTLLNSAVRSKTVSAFESIDLRGHEMPVHREYSLCQEQRTDFAQHILKQCEDHCKLVSNSGILRVDLGEEFLHCSNAAELDSRAERLVAEAHLRSEQPRPCLWHCTGHGFIVRFFLNEVTSTLDVNWFSQQTTFSVVYEAAYATAQQIIRVARLKKLKGQKDEDDQMADEPAAAAPAAAASATPSSKRKQVSGNGVEEDQPIAISVAKRTKAEQANCKHMDSVPAAEPAANGVGGAAAANSNGCHREKMDTD